MNYPAKKIMLVVSILTLLALLVSGCDTESQGGIDQPGAQGAEASPGGEFDGRSTPTPEGHVGDAGQAGEGESGQAEQAERFELAPPDVEEEVSGVDPEDIPSEEERNAILDRVNRGGPDLSGRDEEVGEGPEPGTESVIGQ
jgi:hypothetical protein